jgi:preprotein translocase subunit SecA
MKAKIAEMKTERAKRCRHSPSYLNALTGRGVHVGDGQ